MKFIYFFLFFIISLSYISTASRKAYTLHKNKKVKWSVAKQLCEDNDGHLATPRNKEEANIIKNMFGVKEQSVWLGFHDIFKEFEFITINGDSMQNYFIQWQKDQPDNHRNKERCVYISYKGQLNDFNCRSHLYYVCQNNVTPVQQQNNTKCFTNDIAYMHAEKINKCYKIHLNPQKWSVAKAICEAEGGTLAIIRNEMELEFIVEMFNRPDYNKRYTKYPNQLLIGIHTFYGDNKIVTILDENYHNIFEIDQYLKEQIKFKFIEPCGAINKYGQISDFPCLVPAFFICEKSLLSAEKYYLHNVTMERTKVHETEYFGSVMNLTVNAGKIKILP